jgi:hypothetical protein
MFDSDVACYGSVFHQVFIKISTVFYYHVLNRKFNIAVCLLVLVVLRRVVPAQVHCGGQRITAVNAR